MCRQPPASGKCGWNTSEARQAAREGQKEKEVGGGGQAAADERCSQRQGPKGFLGDRERQNLI